MLNADHSGRLLPRLPARPYGTTYLVESIRAQSYAAPAFFARVAVRSKCFRVSIFAMVP